MLKVVQPGIVPRSGQHNEPATLFPSYPDSRPIDSLDIREPRAEDFVILTCGLVSVPVRIKAAQKTSFLRGINTNK